MHISPVIIVEGPYMYMANVCLARLNYLAAVRASIASVICNGLLARLASRDAISAETMSGILLHRNSGLETSALSLGRAAELDPTSCWREY